MTKRVLTALLSAAMLLSLLAGCGNSSSSASNAGEASAAPTESAKEEAKATVYPEGRFRRGRGSRRGQRSQPASVLL